MVWQQVFFSDLPKDFETLGLIQCTVELYEDEKTAVSPNFLHLNVGLELLRELQLLLLLCVQWSLSDMNGGV